MRFALETPEAPSVDAYRKALTAPIPVEAQAKYRHLREPHGKTGFHPLPPKALPAIAHTPTYDGLYLPAPRPSDPSLEYEWAPRLLADHEGRDWTGPFEVLPDFARLTRAPAERKDLLDHITLTRGALTSTGTMTDEVRDAIQLNLDCRELLDQACYHKHYARHQFPDYVARLRATVGAGRQLAPLAAPLASSPTKPREGLRGLLQAQRNQLQLLEFSDSKYKKLMNTYDELANGWQQWAA
mmetsp:Transcript_106546/g.183700  ORF Transcript_106546/g.183700 Transcript_106546/m.183700 type:complete len:241 (-) Transcript_106546:19-741(-)